MNANEILRPYQKSALAKCLEVLRVYRICFLIGELRTGKTLVGLALANSWLRPMESCLFVTKKKVIPHVWDDYKKAGFKFSMDVTNYEQLAKLPKGFKPSLVIYDESHTLGAFPKPSKRTQLARKRLSGIPSLMLTGTPSPESFSQLFHQFWVTGWGPWTRFTTFYKWAKEYVNIGETWIGNGRKVKDYKDAKPAVELEFRKFKVTMTQKDAGFTGKVIEKIHTLRLPDKCYDLIQDLKEKRFSDRRNLTADSAPKLLMSVHQISSGTYINDDGDKVILDYFKVNYIKKKFEGKKIAVFYCYIAEGDMLKASFNNWTSDPALFAKRDDLVFLCQITSGREGIDLRTADDLIFFNIPYSAVSYLQGRQRTMSVDGGDKTVHFLFTDDGIERDIFEVVKSKKKYTVQHFNKFMS